MEDSMKAVQAVLFLVGLCFTVGCAGASLVVGMALAGRWMKWAPVNLTVTLNDYRDNQ